MTEHLAIRTLGGLAIQLDGTPIEFETQKEAALLVYLACTNRTHPREVLAEMLWEERTQSQALANLRHVLAQLRQRVDPYVTISRQSVAMNTESEWWLDLTAFENQLDAARDQDEDALEAAMDLYQGEFLAGIYVDSVAFEDWMRLERERLRFRAMEALDILTERHLNQREYTKGVARATQLLQMDNLREETYQQLMQLLAQSGQRAQALKQYETCHRVLEEELGVAPLPETTALFNRIRGGEVVVAPDEAIDARPVDIVSDMVTNPYKGLRAFEEADAAEFFGREALTERLLSSLASDTDWARFLAVVGPSGSGKSSVVRAGVVPALRQGAIPGSENWFIASMLPGLHPFDEFEIMLTRAIPTAPPNAMEHLRRDEGGLLRAVRMCLPKDTAETLIVIDQFEEVFTLVDDPAEARSFIDSLYVAATTPRSPVRILITLRADFYDRPLMIPDFSELVRQRNEVVVPMTPEELERAVVGPADQVGVRLEPGLVTEIVAEVSQQPGALPMMEYALTELFDRRVDHILTLEGYQAIGGALGALARRADEVYERLNADRQEAARQLFLRLVTLGEGTEDTRRRTRQAELLSVGGSAMQAALHAFDRSRLLTFDRDPVTHQPHVELAHEAIIREWGRLRGWLDDSRHDIRQQRLLAAAAAEWRGADRERSYLLRGSRLKQFEDWAADTDLALTGEEREYLNLSSIEGTRQQTRRRRVRYLAFAAITIVAIVLAVLALWANSQRSRAEEEKTHAETTESKAQTQAAILLAVQAESDLEDGYYDPAVLLSLEALEYYPYTAQAEHALAQAVTYNRALQRYSGHKDSGQTVVISADWSPDGTKIASIGRDNTIHIWDAANGETIQRIEIPPETENDSWYSGLTVKWTPDGDELLTMAGDSFFRGSQDYTMILWDANTGEQIKQIDIPNQAEQIYPIDSYGIGSDHFSTSATAMFSPLSGRLVTVGGDDTAIVWDDSFENPVQVFVGHERRVSSVAWSPDETRIATSSHDGTVRIWDAATGVELQMFGEVIPHENADLGQNFNILDSINIYHINQVAWSPDGSQIATAGKDGNVRIWDVVSGEEVRIIDTRSIYVWSLAWSSDGTYLITGADDARLIAWNIAAGDILFELNGHTQYISDVVWSPVDDRLVTTGGDGDVRVWNAARSTALELDLPAEWSPDGRSVWSPDGRYFISYRGDLMEVQSWDTETWEQTTVPAIPGQLYISEFDHIMIGNVRQDLAFDINSLDVKQVIDWHTGEVLQTFTPSQAGGPSRDARIAPDGSLLAMGTHFGVLTIWDFETGEETFTDTCGNWITRTAWSPDSTRLAIVCIDDPMNGGPSWAEVRDGTTGEILLTLSLLDETRQDYDPTAFVWSIEWSPDGTRLATIGGNDIVGTEKNPLMIWDATTGESLLTVYEHTGHITNVVWSPNGTRIATSSSDSTTILWDAATGAELLRIFVPANWENFSRFSPDGRFLTTFSDSDEQRFWRVWQSADELIEYAHECCVFRELTPEERAQFGLPARGE